MKTVICLIGLFCMVLSGAARAAQIKDIDIHGFISQGYLQTENNNYIQDSKDGTFQFNEVGINFSTQMENLRIGMQLFARDFGDIGNDEVTIDWAFADYTVSSQLGLRAGIVKIPYGFFNETRYMDPFRTSILLPSSVYNEVYRDAFSGMQCFGLYGSFFTRIGDLDYQLQAGVAPMETDGGFARIMSVFIDADDIETDSSFAGALTYNAPLDNLRFKYSHYQTEFSLKGGASYLQTMLRDIPVGTPIQYNVEVEFNALSAEYIFKRFRLTGEYNLVNVASELEGLTKMSDFDQEGWYLAGAYRFCDYFELGMYYSEFYYYKDDKDGKKHVEMGAVQNDFEVWQKDICLTGRFDISDQWVVKLEGHSVNGTAQIAPNVENDQLDENWYIYLFKVSYSF